MAFKNILLPMTSYPRPTTTGAIERVVNLASELGAHLSGVAFEMDVHLPTGIYADIYSLGDIVAAEYQRSAANARQLIKDFDGIVRRRGNGHEHSLEQSVPAEIAERIVELAHLNDLTIMPVKRDDGGQRDVTEALLFGSGRPVLLFPEASADDLPDRFDQVVIAWDNKGPAARAVADALPFLKAAKTVRVVTIANDGAEKTSPAAAALLQSSGALARHLKRHGINVAVDNLDAKGRAAGDVLTDDVFKSKVDLLVMGAYGHARLREIILGGVTNTILGDPPGYVMLSR